MKQPLRLAVMGAACVAGLVALAGCGSGSSSPKATPTVVPPTPAPSPTVPAVIGGTIIFGTGVSGSQIQNQNTTFTSPKSLAWKATFNSKLAATGPVSVIVRRVAGVGPHPAILWSFSVQLKKGATGNTQSLTKSQLSAHQLSKNDTFSVTYSQEVDVLAQGTFKVASNSGGAGTGY